MTGKKISALSPLTPLDGTEEAVIEVGGQNYRVTTQDIADLGGRPLVTPSTPGYDAGLPGLHFYVNASTGSDSNDGISPSTPFLTIQHGLDVLGSFDYGGQYAGDLEVADGTYTEAIVLPTLLNALGGELYSTNGSAVTTIDLAVGVIPVDAPIFAAALTVWRPSGFTVIAANSDDAGIVYAGVASTVTFGNDLVFDLSNMNRLMPAFYAVNGGHIAFGADFSVTGSPLDVGSALFGFSENGCIALDDVPVVCTFVGTPTIPIIAYGQSEGVLLFLLGGVSALTFSGAVGTGTKKYALVGGSQIVTNIAEASWPGDVAGTHDNWSHYDDVFPSLGMAIGGAIGGGAGTGQVLFDDSGAVLAEAANFNISGGNPNVTAGNAYLYDAVPVLYGNIALSNFFEGGAGNFTVSGVQNNGTGLNCLVNLTTGIGNLAVGTSSQLNNQTGQSNCTIGTSSLGTATAPIRCVAMGASAMGSATGGTDCVALGASALQSNTSGYNNMAIGGSSMLLNNTGHQNTAVGIGALGNNTTGAQNIGIGESALGNVTVSSGNIGIGLNAGLYFNGGGGLTLNTAIGFDCGAFNSTGVDNVSIGGFCWFSGTGSYNTLIGTYNSLNMTSGSGNVCIGNDSAVTGGGTVTSGSRNVVIGYNVGIQTGTANDQLCISNYIYGTGMNGTGATISGGKLGIGIKAPNFNLDVAGSLGCAEAAFILHSSVAITGGATGNVPTLTAGPVTGNPTKWLPYDDNGTTRYIPSW